MGLVPLMGWAGCKGRRSKKARPRDGCSAASLKETRRWLADLCAAHAQKLDSPSHHWWGLPLARADVKLVKRLPLGVLLTLTPRRLLIDGKQAPDWPKPATWEVPDMSRGVGPVITRLLPRLRQTLGASAGSATAKAALEDLARRAAPGVRAPGNPLRRTLKSAPATDLPSGLTVLTMITAKRHLAGRGPRWAHVAIGPRVAVRRVVHLQTLLALAGFDGVQVLFTPRAANDPPAPPAPRIFESLGAIGPTGDSRARRAARRRALHLEERRWERQGCDAMTRLRAALVEASAAERCSVLQTRLPDTLRRCACALDERPLLSLWLAVLGPMDHVGSKTVRLHPRSRAVRAKAGALWADIADRVVARPGHHLWLALAR